MWQQTLVVLLAFTTALPIDVVQAAITKEQVKKIADDILAKVEKYGPLIIKLIAPFVAKKLVELGVIKIGGMIGNQIGKRDVVEGATEVEAAVKYMTQELHDLVGYLKDEFHARVDLAAVNDQIENWQEMIAEFARNVKDLILEGIKNLLGDGTSFDISYIRSFIEKTIGKRAIEERSVTRLDDWDRETLNNYNKMLQELKEHLANRN